MVKALEMLAPKLQRGRAFEGAEINAKLAQMTGPSLLQRGRAFEGAEINPSEAVSSFSVALQRGRAFEGAEMRNGWSHLGCLRPASTGPRF